MPAKAVYRALLYFYPAAFRHEYGDQMLAMFSDQLRETPGRRLGLWLRAAMDVLTVAPREHCHVILQDVRYALRTLAARPSFAIVALLSLVLGIGANTAIFTLWNRILHASLPGVRNPGELAILSDPRTSGMWSGRMSFGEDGARFWLSYGEFQALRDRNRSFTGVMASQSNFWGWSFRVGSGETEHALGRLVSGTYFDVLGVKPAAGRLFTQEEDRGEPPYAVISYDYWQRRFGGRRDVIGTTLTLKHAVLTIIGVSAKGFGGETNDQGPEIWIPIQMQPRVIASEDWLHDKPPSTTMWLNVFGRLKPGVSLAQAEAESNAILQQTLISFYGSFTSEEQRRQYLDQRLKLHPGAGGVSKTRDGFGTSLTLLLSAVGVLLLIACANLSNLLLARGAARRTEMALRLSLGANRSRLVRQLVTEGLLLALPGGALSLGAAYVFHGALTRMIVQAHDDFHSTFELDLPVLAFSFGLSVVAALLFSLLPALQVTKADPGESLKQHSRAAVSLARLGWGRYLVGFQLALCLPLLLCAGLLARSLYHLQHLDLGFQPSHLGILRVDLPESYQGARLTTLFRDLSDQLKQIPGVRAASFSHLGLFSGGNTILETEVDGVSGTHASSGIEVAGPRYFSTLGTPILEGREILESDGAGSPPVCVINEAYASKFLAGRNPLGLRITLIDDDQKGRTTYQVVGVARNAHTANLNHDIDPRIFVPATQAPAGPDNFVVMFRTDSSVGTVIPAIRRTVGLSTAGLRVDSLKSIEEQMAPYTAQDRSIAQLAVIFGSVALLLAAIGLYGVLSYGVARRSGEIAVRIALGARPGRVIGMILRETGGVMLAGLACGAGLSYVAARLVQGRLYDVAALDPLAVAASLGLLIAISLCASLIPALRASRLDPMAALRQG